MLLSYELVCATNRCETIYNIFFRTKLAGKIPVGIINCFVLKYGVRSHGNCKIYVLLDKFKTDF